MVAVGDEVLVSMNGEERGCVEAVLPRRSGLARPDVFYPHLQQLIVANVDQLLIVAAWREPAYWPELVDRYLIAAGRNNLTPIICVNKVDLADDPAEPRPMLARLRRDGASRALHQRQHRRGRGGVAPPAARAHHGAGRAVGRGQVVAAERGRTGARPEGRRGERRKHEGRHTTTQVSLHPLADGGYVVDTPGIREFGLSGLRRRDLMRYYPEIAALNGGCQFEDCTHHASPAAPSGSPFAGAASRRCAMTAIARSSPRCPGECLPRARYGHRIVPC